MRSMLITFFIATSVFGQTRFDAVVDLVEKNYREPLSRDQIEERAIRALLESLDPYSNYRNAEEWAEFERGLQGVFAGVGVVLETDPATKLPRFQYLMMQSPAGSAGARRGDLILAIDGRSTEGLSRDEVIPMLRGTPGTFVELELRQHDAKEVRKIRVQRAAIPWPSVRGVGRTATGEPRYWVDPAKKIAYIRVTKFADDTLAAFESALVTLEREQMKGLVLDLRDSEGGQLKSAVAAADLLLDGGRILSVASRGKDDEVYDGDPRILTRVPIVMLINKWTVSASEIFTGALTDNHRVVTMGQRTFGKGRVQVKYSLPKGMGGIVLSTGTFQRPSGKTIDKHDAKSKEDAGIAPDPGMELVLSEEEWNARMEESFRLDGPHLLSEEEQKFAVRDRELECALDVLGGLIDRRWSYGDL